MFWKFRKLARTYVIIELFVAIELEESACIDGANIGEQWEQQ